MANSRIKDLDPTSDKSGKFIAVDSGSQSDAERFDASELLANSDIPKGSTSLSPGTQDVLFTDIGTVNYLVFASVYDSEGTVSYLISNKLTDRFTVQVAFAATMDYIIFKTS